jgi:hypothetical protein
MMRIGCAAKASMLARRSRSRVASACIPADTRTIAGNTRIRIV